MGTFRLHVGYVLTRSTWVSFGLTLVNFDSTRVRFDVGTFWFGYVLTVIPQQRNCQCAVVIFVSYLVLTVSYFRLYSLYMEGMKYPCPTVLGSEQMQLSAFQLH